jgi:sulfate adenylyltransferase
MMKLTENKLKFNIAPHGGELIIRESKGIEQKELLERAQQMPVLKLSSWSLSDLELIGIGAFSPLHGFMGQEDYLHVLEHMRLANGLVWSIPITLPVSREEAAAFKEGSDVALAGEDGCIYGILHLQEIFAYDKQKEAQKVYGTTDAAHPGVAKVFAKGEVYLAGPITLLNRPSHAPFEDFYMDPLETRQMFADLGWSTVVGFQTRNPVHRAHEYIQKTALEIVLV